TVTIDAATGAYVYTPNTDFSGPDSFTFTVTDAAGHVSAPGTITITVSYVEQAPTAGDDVLSVDENSSGGGTLLGSDPQGDAVTSSPAPRPTDLTVTIDAATGAYVYTPN